MAKTKSKSWVVDRWSIDSMSMWDKDFIDADVPGYFEFGANTKGSFQFGYVQGELDYRVTERDGKPAVEFSYEGVDEDMPCSGRGWMILEGERLQGMFYIHLGDESEVELIR